MTDQWKATVRRTVEAHSSESENYRAGREDLFYPTHGIASRSGVWELKSMRPHTEPATRAQGGARKQGAGSSRRRQDIKAILRSEEQRHDEKGFFDPRDVQDARERAFASVVRRRGQPRFRRRLLSLYGGRCAVTGCDAAPALEAAHIIAYKGDNTNHPSNGLLLRADVHTLFDLRLIAVDSRDMTVLVAPELQATEYGALAGRTLRLPSDSSARPSSQALDIHREEAGY